MTQEDIEKSIRETWSMFKKLDEEFEKRTIEADKRSKELDERFKEIAERFRETDEKFKETSEKFKETSEKFKETSERFKETDEKFKETDEKFRETDERFKETNEKFKEAAIRSKELDEKIDKVLKGLESTKKIVNDLTGKWGKFVESLVKPSAIKMFKERGIDIDYTYTRVERSKNGESIEIDIVAANDEYLVLISVKSTLKVANVDEHINNIKRFRDFFPIYKNHKIIGAVAGIVIEEDADRYAYHKGLFVIAPRGKFVKILNDTNFKPTIF